MDLRDLVNHVGRNPDAHEQRWRLAKRLYMASEYDVALEHLTHLKEQWEPRVNVSRYLAATYYRLERYDEAIAELRYAIETWPDESSLHKQLARVLQTAGKGEEAAEIFGEAATLDPAACITPAPKKVSSDPGFTSSPPPAPARDNTIPCPTCGARNGTENSQCWKCFTQLIVPENDPQLSVVTPTSMIPPSHIWIWVLVGGIMTTILLSFSVYMIMGGLAKQFVHSDHVATQLNELLDEHLFTARAVSGVLLIAGWPLLLFYVFRRLNHQVDRPVVVALAGILPISAICSILWLPLHLMIYALTIPILGSLAIFATTLGLRFGQAIVVWFIQTICISVIIILVYAITLGPHALIQLPQIAFYSAHHDTLDNQNWVLEMGGDQAQITHFLFRGSGSSWLDALAGHVQVEVRSTEHALPFVLEMNQEDTVVHRAILTEPFDLPHVFSVHVQPDISYKISFQGRPASLIIVIGRSILEFVQTSETDFR